MCMQKPRLRARREALERYLGARGVERTAREHLARDTHFGRQGHGIVSQPGHSA